MTKLIYLAGPIDNNPRPHLTNRFRNEPRLDATPYETLELMAAAMQTLIDHTDQTAALMYLPQRAWCPGLKTQHTNTINTINNLALEKADALIAVWPKQLDSFGTGVEIGHALACDKPTHLVTNRDTWSTHGNHHLDVHRYTDLAPDSQPRDWSIKAAALTALARTLENLGLDVPASITEQTRKLQRLLLNDDDPFPYAG